MKTHLAKRNFRSEKEAIKKISSKFGVTKVLKIGKDYILEKFVDFNYKKLSLSQLSILLKEIHSEKNNSYLPLVHGDFSSQNTTLYLGEPKCFDYEYSHFGNAYVDIGRVLLRDCNDFKDVKMFFDIYSGNIPNLNLLKDGLIYFCDWQNSLRLEKNLLFEKVPLIRKERIKQASNNLEEIIEAFKSEVKIK